jgi:hypothetical protein
VCANFDFFGLGSAGQLLKHSLGDAVVVTEALLDKDLRLVFEAVFMNLLVIRVSSLEDNFQFDRHHAYNDNMLAF